MIRALLSLVRHKFPNLHRRYLLSVAASVLCQVAMLWAFISLVSTWVHRDVTLSLIWLGVIVVLLVTSWFLDSLVQKIGMEIGFELLQSTQHELADRIVRIPSSWFSVKRRHSAVHILSGIGPELVGAFGYVLTPAITAFALPAVLAVTVLVAGIAYGAGIFIGVVAIAAWVMTVVAYRASIAITTRADSGVHDAMQHTSERLVEFAAQQRTLRAFRQANSERSELLQSLATEKSALLRLIGWQVPGKVLFSVALNIALGGISAVALWNWARGDIDAITAIGFVIIAVRMLEPLGALSDIAEGAEAARRLATEIDELTHAPQLPEPRQPQPVDDHTKPPAVQVRNVSFSYDDDVVLDDVSFELEPGTTTALVGPSGSGKTTVLSLIAGLEKPSSGDVLIDGQPASPGQASIVFQFPYLFTGTIADNIGAQHLTPSQQQELFERTNLVDVVAHQVDGLDSGVAEEGKNLSGGQRQRVSIARALAHPSRLLLIDEATSALDYENEKTVNASLKADGYTRLIIAHRPGAIRGVDRIIRLDRGRIVSDEIVEPSPH